MNYSKAIRIARAVSDIPQKELADRISLDPSLISLLEAGKRRPSLATLEKIADELGIPFHLFTLLAAEPEDLRDVSPEDMAQFATSLTKLLLRGSINDPGGSSGGFHSKAEHSESERSGSQARDKRRKAA